MPCDHYSGDRYAEPAEASEAEEAAEAEGPPRAAPEPRSVVLIAVDDWRTGMRPLFFAIGPAVMVIATAVSDPWGFCLFGVGAFILGCWVGFNASDNPGHEPVSRPRA